MHQQDSREMHGADRLGHTVNPMRKTEFSQMPDMLAHHLVPHGSRGVRLIAAAVLE